MIDSYPDEVRKKILERVKEIAPLLELLPGIAVIHDIRDGSVIHMTEKGVQQLGVSLEELQGMGPAYYANRFFNSAEANQYVPQMLAMVERNDPNETFTFFQQVKFASDDSWNWHLSAIRILAQDDHGKPVATLLVSQLIKPDQHYTPKIERLLDELTFLRKNIKTFSALGKREIATLRLQVAGHTSQEIADKMHISVKTVETHRKNIRKKLGAKTQAEVDRYARAFDLI